MSSAILLILVYLCLVAFFKNFFYVRKQNASHVLAIV